MIARRVGLPALVGIVAAAYFLVAATHGIERADEGHLVYFGARVADGALPVRDFRHWYGPSVFFVNGWLMQLFGADLLVVRLALVTLHALMVAAMFVLTRVVAGVGAAAVVALLAIVLGGLPLWVFNAPYATNYQLPLTMMALAAWVFMPDRPRTRLVVMGLCLGVVATFKPTGGLVSLAGIVTFLLSRVDEGTNAGARRLATLVSPVGASTLEVDESLGVAASTTSPSRRRLVATLAIGAMLAVLAVLGVISASVGAPSSVVLLLGPSLALAVWALLRVRRASTAQLAQSLVDLAWLAAAFAVAPIALAAYYAAHGLLGALLWDVLLGLPRQFALFAAYPWPSGRIVVLLGVAAVSIAAAACRADSPFAAVARVVAPAVVLAFVAALALDGRAHLAGGGWRSDLFGLVFWLPPVAVWATTIFLIRAPRSDASTLLTIMSATLLPGLAPVSDLPHVLLAVRAYLPVGALALREVRDAAAPAAVGRHAAAALLACWVVVLAVPCVAMLIDRARAAGPAGTYERASFIADDTQPGADVAALVAHLRARPNPYLFTLPSETMLYFLAGKRSPLDGDEFAFYAAVTGPQLTADDARALVDQDAAVRRLQAVRPLVVRVRGGVEEFRRVFPAIAAYVGRAYRPVATFGKFELLAPAPRRR